MNMRAVAAVTALLLATCTVASADYHFYGVADEDFSLDNDRLWEALEPYPEWDASRATLHDAYPAWDGDTSGDPDCIYDDIVDYGTRLQSGDVFLFAYSAHGGWSFPDSLTAYLDEDTNPPPDANDPSPPTDPPYAGDEYLPNPGTGGLTGLEDDLLTDAFAAFDPGVEVVVVSAACHAGGWVGGGHDLDTSTPAGNSGLYALLGAPEQATCVGLAEAEGEPADVLLTTTLINTLEPYMTISEWYDAAATWGQTATAPVQRAWDDEPQTYTYWPEQSWVPTTYEATYQTDHWGWQETYLQLRPWDYSTLDGAHDAPMATPEPATTAMIVLGLLGIGAGLRRRRGDAAGT